MNINYDELLAANLGDNDSNQYIKDPNTTITDSTNQQLLKKKRNKKKKNKQAENPAGSKPADTNISDYINTIMVHRFSGKSHKLFIAKIKEIEFETDNDLFVKGRNGEECEDTSSLPSLGFWHQRYYYFSRFDEGIKMDYQSE